jgi:putative membrane protein insertion efficiency factor
MREIPKFVVLQLLRAYKWAVSPLFPPACRYVPTCSEYAMEAVDRFGALRGGFKGLLRLMRCHPLSRGGYDPVVPHSHPHNEPPTANDQRQTVSVSYPGAMRGNC